MRKGAIIFLIMVFAFALIVWFSCSPFQGKNSTDTDFNVFDELSGTRLTISCTIYVNGVTWDGAGQTLVQAAGNPLGDGSQAESQQPFFRLTNGTIKNFTIQPPAADGMHFFGGNATMSGIYCSDVGEDLITVKGTGTFYVTNVTGNSAADKFIQVSNLCTITCTSVSTTGSGKFMREYGGMTWKMTSYANGCTANNMSECVFRSDASVSTFFYRSLNTNCGTIGYPGTKIATY
jgi:pectate lyase C